jgi:cell cycle checkpoint protein
MEANQAPVLKAVSSSARQLSLLLRTIAFSPKAEVQITAEGIRFSVEQSLAVQGLTFLDKSLFSSYTFESTSFSGTGRDILEDTTSAPSFEIDIIALLETLQIFGLSDAIPPASRNPNGGFGSLHNYDAFNTPALAIHGGTCRIIYPYIGAPLSITISEAGVTTTCELNTYSLSHGAAGLDMNGAISLQRDALTLKVIMRSAWLYDAVTELACTNPTVFALTASPQRRPIFAIEGTGGPFGDSIIDFQPDTTASRTSHLTDNSTPSFSTTTTAQARPIPLVSETFSVQPSSSPTGSHGQSSSSYRIRHRYRFAHIQKATRAMGLATRVSLRCDRQGVLSLQFMVDALSDGRGGGRVFDDDRTRTRIGNGNGARGVEERRGRAIDSGDGEDGGDDGRGKTSFVDFRLVPMVDEDDDVDVDEDQEDENQANHWDGEEYYGDEQ